MDQMNADNSRSKERQNNKEMTAGTLSQFNSNQVGYGVSLYSMMPANLGGTSTTQLKEYLTRYLWTDTNHMRW
jgi:hypothetical protein